MNPLVQGLVEALFSLSSALLVPVMLLLLVAFAWSVVELGIHAAEALERRRDVRALRELMRRPPEARAAAFFASEDYRGILGAFADAGREVQGSPRELGRIIDELESAIDGRITRAIIGVRVGPALGLMGTLIPMGPALTSLASGDIEGMANNLVIAFATTVVGIAVGGVAYLVAATRRRWHAADLRTLEYLQELSLSASPPEPPDA